MSYFIFGVIDHQRTSLSGETSYFIDSKKLAESCAILAKLFAHVDGNMEPAILDEMRGSRSTGSSISFFLTKSSSDDTSDSLISPYAADSEELILAIQAIGQWVDCILRSNKFERIELWMTEGYEDIFEHVECMSLELVPLLMRRVHIHRDMSSLHISIIRKC